MTPERFRKRRGFAAIHAAPMVLFSAVPALAAPIASSHIASIVPLAIAVGGVGFGLLAMLLVRKSRNRSHEIEVHAHQQIAELGAELDLTTSILDGLNEVTIMWHGTSAPPRVFGQSDFILNPGEPVEKAADFRRWLPVNDGTELARLSSRLKTDGTSFDTSMTCLRGQLVRISGRVLGGAAVIRIRPATTQPDIPQPTAEHDFAADMHSAEFLFARLQRPAWLRDADGTLVYVNDAYRELAKEMGIQSPSADMPEIMTSSAIDAGLEKLEQGHTHFDVDIKLDDKHFDMSVFPVDGGTAGILRPSNDDVAAAAEAQAGAIELGKSAAIIDAIATPIAIFDRGRRLRHFNHAYASFWELDPEWLNSGVDEVAILDKLRTQGQLPSEADYRAWRAKHLSSYTLDTAREEPWYLPDGRTINVVSVPTHANDGVVYVFEDITEQLALESRYNALIHVQSETLGALSEGVAVFGTNGRLTLSNPRLSLLWKLPMNELGQHPHIDQIAEACAKTMPEDGATIWADLKKNIVDLNPSRSDRSGRITRADGRMIDYAATRLPDGQTMMTFVDVTESANYQKVLKERNDALVTADRLKDAFVQNVSYELRSPLTNIIGFADLLASESAGELNEKQRSYTDYIRASSQTLGVLIDNILDLATADAGVAELRLEAQDIPTLIERARAGLASTLTAGGSETPPNLIVEIDDDLPDFVADGTRIVQVLYNLLSNAARFSAPGAEVKLGVSSRAGRIVFSVEDEGVGISEEMKAAMFQRFEGHSSEGRQRGAGLGLAIVKTFVSLHGGTITLERREPRGTRVVVSIPANPAEAVSAAE